MRRLFFIVFSVILIVTCCSCDTATESDIGLHGECEYVFFSAYNEDFFITVTQFADFEVNSDNSDIRYLNERFKIAVTPLKLQSEEKALKLKYQNFEREFKDGNYTAEAEGIARDDGITIFYDSKETEIYLEENIKTDVKSAMEILIKNTQKEIAPDGEIKIKYLKNFDNIFIFAGFYREEKLICAVLIDDKGQFITSI